MVKSYTVRRILLGDVTFLTSHESGVFALNYREHKKILLAMPLDLAKTGGHEVCSRIRARLYCLYIAKLRGVAAALSGKAGATV